MRCPQLFVAIPVILGLLHDYHLTAHLFLSALALSFWRQWDLHACRSGSSYAPVLLPLAGYSYSAPHERGSMSSTAVLVAAGVAFSP